jgi:hypothetical protein
MTRDQLKLHHSVFSLSSSYDSPLISPLNSAISNGPTVNGVKATRKRKTTEQEYILVTYYNEDNFPSKADILVLAKQANIPKKDVTCWFRNRRKKLNWKLKNQARLSGSL